MLPVVAAVVRGTFLDQTCHVAMLFDVAFSPANDSRYVEFVVGGCCAEVFQTHASCIYGLGSKSSG